MKKIVCFCLRWHYQSLCSPAVAATTTVFRQPALQHLWWRKTVVRRFLKAAWIFLQKPNWS